MIQWPYQRMVKIVELSTLKSKRQVLHTLNLGIVILIILSSALSIFLAVKFESDLTASLFAIISCVCGVIGLIIEQLLPKKENWRL